MKADLDSESYKRQVAKNPDYAQNPSIRAHGLPATAFDNDSY